MKKLIVILLVLIATNSFAQEKLGLLIIAHGSPAKQWNQPVLDIEKQVKELLRTKNVTDFDEVRIALMEFTEPSIATAVKDMENKGITKIFALPLFIAPSGHSLYDIPTILGLYYDENMANTSGYLMMGRTMETNKMFKGKNIYFAEDGLLPDKRVTEWIVDRSIHCLKILE